MDIYNIHVSTRSLGFPLHGFDTYDNNELFLQGKGRTRSMDNAGIPFVRRKLAIRMRIPFLFKADLADSSQISDRSVQEEYNEKQHCVLLEKRI